MRLSTDPTKRNEAHQAHEVLQAALAAGVTLFDTADAYCLDATEAHHNEKLLAQALQTQPNTRANITIVTKGGLTRPEGRWLPDGRATHLRTTCEQSIQALGGAPLDLYLLHAPDPKISLSTSVRALAELHREGLVRAIGLSNVTATQLEEACALAPISAVEIELSLLNINAIHGGVLDVCIERNLRLIAHSPLGGAKGARKLARDPTLKTIAERHNVAPADIALAWLYALHPSIVPIPGATRVETARAAAVAAQLILTDQDKLELADRFEIKLPYKKSAPPAPSSREVVILMGIQAAGKSTLVTSFVERGYHRLNRDLSGGKLRDLLPELEKLLEPETARVVLDNTYASRAARGAVIATARKRGAAVRCIFLDTSTEDAQINAISRMLERYGRLLDPEEIRKLSKKDPNTFRPDVQFRFRRELEKPVLEEGFSTIEIETFKRKQREPTQPRKRGILFELDGVIRKSRSGQRAPTSPDDVELLEGRRERLHRAVAEGFQIYGISWRPEVASRALDTEMIQAIDARTAELLSLPLESFFCPHGAGPAICWCRKPLPGLGVVWLEKYAIDPATSLHVGHGPADRTFATRLGLAYLDAQEYFI